MLNILNYLFKYNNRYKIIFKLGIGIGDWGLGIGDWAQSPIPNPQSPIPNPKSSFILNYYIPIKINNLIKIF